MADHNTDTEFFRWGSQAYRECWGLQKTKTFTLLNQIVPYGGGQNFSGKWVQIKIEAYALGAYTLDAYTLH